MRDLGIKLFADGANIKDMVEVYEQGIVSGFTTNPTLMKKAGVKNYKDFALEVIDEIPDMPISFEVFSDDLETMEKEARTISSWADNIYVKIPVTNTTGVSTTPIIDILTNDGIKLNITAILTSDQVANILDYLKDDVPSIISIFAGRIADTGRNPIPIIESSIDYMNDSGNYDCELLWASTRELYNIIQAQECDCNIITVTNDILKKLPMLDKDLDELSLDTVKMFRDDAVSSGFKI